MTEATHLEVSVRRKQPTADPLIFGASIPGNEPVPVLDEYVALTGDEICEFWHTCCGLSANDTLRHMHRAGWERRRTP